MCLSFLLAAIMGLHGQVTINLEDVLPQVGQTFESFWTDYVDVSEFTGSDQVLDFNNLMLENTENYITVIDVSVGNGVENFEGADIQITIPKEVSSGVYFLKVVSDEFVLTQKVILE